MHVSTKITVTALAMAIGLGAASAVHAQDRAVNIKANIENRIEQNKDARNTLLDKRQDMKRDIKLDARVDTKLMRASTTTMFKRTQEIRKDMAKRMEFRAFEARRNALVKELTHSLANLTNISTRIMSRIEKAESEGRTMTEARALLITANEKLVTARAEVAAFQALSPVVSTSTSTTTEADLTKPRALGDAAIKSVKEARNAYQKAVVAIAHAMGRKVGTNATTTPPADN